jgi:hypothetical protein
MVNRRGRTAPPNSNLQDCGSRFGRRSEQLLPGLNHRADRSVVPVSERRVRSRGLNEEQQMSSRHRKVRTVVAAGVLAPLCAFAALPAFADGEQTPPGAQSTTEVCQGVPSDYAPFTDVQGNLFEDQILCMAYAKVTRGGAGGAPASSYVPEALVGRDAMASAGCLQRHPGVQRHRREHARCGDQPPRRGRDRRRFPGRLRTGSLRPGRSGDARADGYVPAPVVGVHARPAGDHDRRLLHRRHR